MEDTQPRCPACGTEYLSAVLHEISGNREDAEEQEQSLDDLEQLLQPLDQAPLPTSRETLRRMLPGLYGLALLFCLLAGIATHANLFYLLAIIPAVLLVLKLPVLLRRTPPMGRGEILIRAAARVFSEDAAALQRKAAKEGSLGQRLDALQLRIDQALERQRQAHARNARRIRITAGIILLAACAGAGWLALHNHAVRKAEAEYAARPEWERRQEAYRKSDPDAYGSDKARSEVIRAMLQAEEAARAEEFFFTACQGRIGDLECAEQIVAFYRSREDAEALRTFAGKVTLRYDSDTRKIRSIKR